MLKVNAYALNKKGAEKLTPFSYELDTLGAEQVDIKIHYCGLCHSDISMIENAWGMTKYPLVPGHEIIGEVIAVGDQVKNLEKGDYVGVGWKSASCMHCNQCMNGQHHLCQERRKYHRGPSRWLCGSRT